MENLYCELETLKNESDVEQKFLYEFLSSATPLGLGFSDSEIDTKKCIKAYTINKGKKKSYIPDYIISVRGIPLIIIEAKNPNENLNEAYAEAQLYANQINVQFAHNVNPCRFVIVSNGVETLIGHIDSSIPVCNLSFSDFKTDNIKFVTILEKCSKAVLSEFANNVYKKQRANSVFKTPVSVLGGKQTTNEEMISNDFGNALISDYRNIFDPETEDDRILIVQNAYVPSKKREQHIEPIYKEIKKIKYPSLKNATLISTHNPIELVKQVENNVKSQELQSPLIILIGNRGSGKTTFIRYFKEKIITTNYQELGKECCWCFLDMNYAPLEDNEIYKWVKNEIIISIQETYSSVNFNTKELLENLYSEEIDNFKNGVGQFLVKDSESYNQELYKIIIEANNSLDVKLKSYIKYLKNVKNKIPIIVFDNCDKNSKDKQLLMFEVAQWVRKQFKCIVILPMRDITYDMYKDEPPLDTFVRDLVFRIDPPDLLKVLLYRLTYIERINKNLQREQRHYTLENNIKVLIEPEQLIDYYRQILHIIRKDDWAREIFFRLSNRDIRGAIQLFEDLCRSGHIKTSEILNIKLLGSDYTLPSYKIMNALLRKNRKYYTESNSNFTNIFASDFKDDFPDPFVRLDILYWLKTQKDIMGPNAILGFHKVEKLIKDLQPLGHNEIVIKRELENLAKKSLILNENQHLSIEENDLIRISPAGSLHLNLLKNVSYLAACSEAILYRNSDIKERVAKRLATTRYLDLPSQISNAKDMLSYLQDYKQLFLSNPNSYLQEECIFKGFDLQVSLDSIIKVEEQLSEREQLFGCDIQGKIIYREKKSILLKFEENLRGFLATNDPLCNLTEEVYDRLIKDNILKCKVLSYDESHNSYKLMFLEQII